MRWANPEYFYGVFIVLAVWVLHIILLRRDQSRAQKTFSPERWKVLSASFSSIKQKWKLFLRVMAFIFVFLALARPQMGASQQEVKSEGIEILFLVDVSDSMMAEDLKPNRLEQAKIELSKLVDQLSGHKIGVIAFAGSAALLSPLSNDPTAIKMYLESLSTFAVSSQGTNFKSALDEAVTAFERGGVEGDSTTQVTKVLVIASDGEDHEPGAVDLVKKLKDKGVRIFTIAYGTEKGAPIPVRDKLGYLRDYKKDQSGQTVLSTVKGGALQALAETGGGQFYFATFGGEHLRKLAADLDQLEKTQFDTTMTVQYDEKFQVFLLLGVVFLLLDLILGVRSRLQLPWKGRFEVNQ